MSTIVCLLFYDTIYVHALCTYAYQENIDMTKCTLYLLFVLEIAQSVC